jgi:hypothetical protein
LCVALCYAHNRGNEGCVLLFATRIAEGDERRWRRHVRRWCVVWSCGTANICPIESWIKVTSRGCSSLNSTAVCNIHSCPTHTEQLQTLLSTACTVSKTKKHSHPAHYSPTGQHQNFSIGCQVQASVLHSLTHRRAHVQRPCKVGNRLPLPGLKEHV